MAITFESIKDPYGLGAAGNAIGGAFMQKAMMDSQEKRKISEEERLRNQQIQNSQTLGTTLKDMMPGEGQEWDQDRIASFMAQALESGASIQDVVNSIKGLEAGRPKPKSMAATPFAKEMGKKNATLYTAYTDQGRKAKEMLSTMEAVDNAINDPNRSDNIASRSLKMLPGAEVTFDEGDQAMANFSKEFVTNFTNMKDLRLTDAKLKWISNVPPAPWKSREANIVSSANAKRLLQLQDAYGEVARSIADSYLGAGLDVPANFEKLVEDAIEPIRQEIDQMYKMSTQGEEKAPVDVGSKFDKMPNPKEYEGAEITDSKGNKFVSNGTKWSKVK